MTNTNCYDCKFRKDVEHTNFSRCLFFSAMPKKALEELDPEDVPMTNDPRVKEKPWWDFPTRYAPQLMDNDCYMFTAIDPRRNEI